MKVSNDRRTYWTENGIGCYHSKAACGNCPIFLVYGLSKNDPENQCLQPQSNQHLLDKGVMPPPDLGKADRLLSVFIDDRKAVNS